MTIRESGLTLSRAAVPVGSVVFVVTNDGARPHQLRVDGKATPSLRHGGRASLLVRFARGGSYRLVASGIARARTLTVLTQVATAASSPAPARPGSNATPPQPCTNPTNSTVAVTMTDTFGTSGYSFSPEVVPCGTATFVLTNVGANQHGLGLKSPTGIEAPAAPAVDPHQTGTLTATLGVKGSYQWWDSEGEGFETTYGMLTVS